MKLHTELKEGGLVPTRAYATDAGLDLYSGTEDFLLHKGQRKAVDTGIRIAVPDGYVGLIMEKSGLALNRGISILGGVVDSGYRGNIKVVMYNSGNEDVLIQYGNKIAQLLVLPIATPEVQVTDTLPEAGDERNERGFGSTGL